MVYRFFQIPVASPLAHQSHFQPYAYTCPLCRLFACLTAIFSLLEAARLGTPLHRAIYHSAPFSSLFSAIPFGAGFATPQRNHRSIASYLPQLLPTFRNSQFRKKKDCVDISTYAISWNPAASYSPGPFPAKYFQR